LEEAKIWAKVENCRQNGASAGLKKKLEGRPGRYLAGKEEDYSKKKKTGWRTKGKEAIVKRQIINSY